MAFPNCYLARHGETEWSVIGRHTGLTDLPLTVQGELNARQLGEKLKPLHFVAVFTSPLQRARRTCELAGLGDRAVIDPDLVEWNYGAYEGRRTDDIRKERPGWEMFRDGCPEGETAAQVGTRADRVIARLRAIDGNTLVFAHRHLLCVLAARWVGLLPEQGRVFTLSEGKVSTLAYNHALDDPVVQLWNGGDPV